MNKQFSVYEPARTIYLKAGKTTVAHLALSAFFAKVCWKIGKERGESDWQQTWKEIHRRVPSCPSRNALWNAIRKARWGDGYCLCEGKPNSLVDLTQVEHGPIRKPHAVQDGFCPFCTAEWVAIHGLYERPVSLPAKMAGSAMQFNATDRAESHATSCNKQNMVYFCPK